MSSITRRTFTEATSELRYLLYSRRSVVLGLVLLAGAATALLSSSSHARASLDTFQERLGTFEQNGLTLDQALSAPMKITVSNGAETIDNPLRYDFLRLSESVGALDGVAAVGTALDFTTFIIVPLAFAMLGAGVANVDRSSGTLAFRASRERWTVIVAAKVLSLALISAAGALVIALGGAAASLFTRGVAADLREQIGRQLFEVAPGSMIAKLAMTTLVATFFAVVGFVVGGLTRSSSWPMVLLGLALFLLPFASRWDPRNVLAVLSQRVYDFWGQFEMRPPLELSYGAALLVLVGYGLVLAAGVTVLARRLPLR